MKVLITGTAGFIGFHLAKSLMDHGFTVQGYDGLTDYYDLKLKNNRLNILLKHSNFTFTKGMLEDYEKLENLSIKFQPDIVIHLAAQAGVRYSLDNPRSYINSNIIGTFNLLEISRKSNIKHLLIASSSSVYGANSNVPFSENDKADTQLSIYAATKKANESMAHSYSHLWKIPITMFRFFTVYGPWGRPDMALFKFVKAILNEDPIDIYNHGNMYRDYTYIDDLVYGIKLLIDKTPESKSYEISGDNDSISPVAPFRIVNIGNEKKVKLLDFIETIEDLLEKKSVHNYLPMQKGDVTTTLANTSLLKNLTGFKPQTNFKVGISRFVEWYRDYYKI